MRIIETITYAAAPDAVYAMVTDPGFQEQKCIDAGATEHESAVSRAGDGMRVVTTRDLPSDGLPDFAKSLIGSTLSVTETYEWGAAQDGGVRSGTLTVEVRGAPVALRSTVRLAPSGAGTTISIDGDLKASIPLLGGKVEKAAAPAVVHAIKHEQETGTRWLAERG